MFLPLWQNALFKALEKSRFVHHYRNRPFAFCPFTVERVFCVSEKIIESKSKNTVLIMKQIIIGESDISAIDLPFIVIIVCFIGRRRIFSVSTQSFSAPSNKSYALVFFCDLITRMLGKVWSSPSFSLRRIEETT